MKGDKPPCKGCGHNEMKHVGGPCIVYGCRCEKYR